MGVGYYKYFSIKRQPSDATVQCRNVLINSVIWLNNPLDFIGHSDGLSNDYPFPIVTVPYYVQTI